MKTFCNGNRIYYRVFLHEKPERDKQWDRGNKQNKIETTGMYESS